MIFRDLGFKRTDRSLGFREMPLGRTSKTTNMPAASSRSHAGNFGHTKSRYVGTAIAANRAAAFASAATNGFQFRRQKGWKILLFERLALFL
jgi:hypothetical protein